MDTTLPINSGVSIVICCYNSQNRIIPTLSAIAKQIIADFSVEIIIVNNASTDNTSTITQNTWNALNAPFPLSIIEEKTPGLNAARIAGIKNAQHPIILLCDDDNHLYPDYLSVLVKTFWVHPEVGAVGGQGIPLFESQEPEWFESSKGAYAVGAQLPGSGYAWVLYGACLALRNSACQKLLSSNFQFIGTDRKGNQLASGGDTELCLALRILGFKLWYEESLKFFHAIPANRLQWSYLIRLHEGFTSAGVYHDIYQSYLSPSPPKNYILDLFKKWTYFLAICIKYYPQYNQAKEGNPLILNYIGWKQRVVSWPLILPSLVHKKRKFAEWYKHQTNV
jgi:glycosyltransferase involved in cell wall biosynthesis